MRKVMMFVSMGALLMFAAGALRADEVKVTGVHNCCTSCCKAIHESLGKVEGVKADTLKPKSRKFVVEGEFDAVALIKALNNAGFSARNADAPRRKKKKSDK